MPAEAAQDGLTAGSTYYTVWRDAANQVSNGSAFVTYGTAARNAGAVADTVDAQGTAAADLPAHATAAGLYRWAKFLQAGGSPAESDVCVASGEYRLGPAPANATQLAGQTVTAAAGVTFPAAVADNALIDTEVAAIKAKTDNLPADPADASDVAAAFAAVTAALTTIDDFLDTEVAAIKAKTDLIPATPATPANVWAAVPRAGAQAYGVLLEASAAALFGLWSIDGSGREVFKDTTGTDRLRVAYTVNTLTGVKERTTVTHL